MSPSAWHLMTHLANHSGAIDGIQGGKGKRRNRGRTKGKPDSSDFVLAQARTARLTSGHLYFEITVPQRSPYLTRPDGQRPPLLRAAGTCRRLLKSDENGKEACRLTLFPLGSPSPPIVSLSAFTALQSAFAPYSSSRDTFSFCLSSLAYAPQHTRYVLFLTQSSRHRPVTPPLFSARTKKKRVPPPSPEQPGPKERARNGPCW
jgi:hypothetical protein